MTDRRYDERYDRRVFVGAQQLLGSSSHRDAMSLPADRLPVPVAARLALVVAELSDPGKVLWTKTPEDRDRAGLALQAAVKTVRRWGLAEPEAILVPAVELSQLCGRKGHSVRLEADGSMSLPGHPDVDMALEKVSVALGAEVPACIRAHPEANTMWPRPVADDGLRFEPICAGELLAFVVLVRQWFAAGYDLWSAARALHLAIEADELKGHLALGMPIDDAIDWQFCAAGDVRRWQACGFSAADAETWHLQGRSLDSLEQDVVTVREGRWLARWARLVGPRIGTEAVVEWARFGQPVGVWGEAAARGLRAPEVAPWLEAGFESVEILRYAHLSTPLAVACDWRAAGFTAYVACGYLGVGIELADAVELRGLPVQAVQELWPTTGSVDAVRRALA